MTSIGLYPAARRRTTLSDRVLAWAASICALLDGLTTILSLSQGGIELNPLVGQRPSVTLLLALSFCKVLAVLASLATPLMFRRPFLAGAVVVWGGVSMNNLLVATPWPDPLPMLGGVLTAVSLLVWTAGRTLRATPSAAR